MRSGAASTSFASRRKATAPRGEPVSMPNTPIRRMNG
jgi:hypothetical protein